MKLKSICRNQWQKKDALCKQTALDKAALNTALSKQALYTVLYTTTFK